MSDFPDDAREKKNRGKISRLVSRVRVATAKTLQALACPLCGGGLNIQYARTNTGKGAGSSSVMCAQCTWRVVSDGILREPPWVKDLGTKFHTAAKPGLGRKEIKMNLYHGIYPASTTQFNADQSLNLKATL